jgi:hypothetical protein
MDKEKAAPTAALRAHRSGFVACVDDLSIGRRGQTPSLESARGYFVPGILAEPA